jgi:hypothetical protein
MMIFQGGPAMRRDAAHGEVAAHFGPSVIIQYR